MRFFETMNGKTWGRSRAARVGLCLAATGVLGALTLGLAGCSHDSADNSGPLVPVTPVAPATPVGGSPAPSAAPAGGTGGNSIKSPGVTPIPSSPGGMTGH